MAVITLRPNAAGNYQAWTTFPTPGASHWGNTSDQSDLTGVYTNNIILKETEALATFSGAGFINKVIAFMTAFATGSDPVETVSFIWRNRSRDYSSSAYTVPRSPSNIEDEQINNPLTELPWEWSDLDDLEIGAQAVALGAGEEICVSEFWIEVDYSENLKRVNDSGEGSEGLDVSDMILGDDSGSLSSEKVRVYRTTPPEPETIEEALGSSTRTVEVVRVGSIALRKEYPAKQIVRLRDMASLYDGGPIKELAQARKNVELYKRGRRIGDEYWSQTVPDDTQLAPALLNLNTSIEEIYQRLQGKRLSGVDVEIWDQISGAYLGSVNTDEHGTLVLPTDRQFVEVLQWKLSGGGYSDCFNGERAAGTPGLFFYFPCNEGTGTTIKSFPGVSGQQATLPSNWNWYDSGFFNRPALKSNGNQLTLEGAWPTGRRGFQFLWYCKDATRNSLLFTYSGDAFRLEVYNGYLKGLVRDATPVQGTTELYSDNWYLIQINTQMYYGFDELSFSTYALEMNVYVGSELDLSVPISYAEQTQNVPLVVLAGYNQDGFDEIRHMDRELYSSERVNYAGFLKNGRRQGKSQGTLGSPGW